MKFEVTANDILNGKRRDCSRCPMAIALNRKLGFTGAGAASDSPKHVEVGGYAVTVRGVNGYLYRGYLSKEAAQFVGRFDGYEAVYPGTFEIEF